MGDAKECSRLFWGVNPPWHSLTATAGREKTVVSFKAWITALAGGLKGEGLCFSCSHSFGVGGTHSNGAITIQWNDC
eukprot:343774-Rhodomonas_salina.3